MGGRRSGCASWLRSRTKPLSQNSSHGWGERLEISRTFIPMKTAGARESTGMATIFLAASAMALC